MAARGRMSRGRLEALLRRVAPATVAAVVFLGVAALYVAGDTETYEQVIAAWGVQPFAFPFLDTDTVMSALRCLRLGIDVFATNPCDVLGRVYDYSPLWLAAAALPITTAWLVPVGLGVDLCFLLCLLLLPPGRSWREAGLIAAGTVSTAVVFAVERGNNDLVIFALAACAAALACRGWGLRLIGYGLALLAGLLKYYPLALMALAVRERPRAFAGVALAAAGALAAFVAIEGAELARALALIPTGSYFGDMFGAKTLPGGLALLLRLDVSHGLATRAGFVLVAGALAAGALMGSGSGTGDDLARLTAHERMFLAAGALLVIGCFATAQNIGYRAVHLLLVLPGLVALCRVGRRPRLYGFSAAVLLMLLWVEGGRHWLAVAFATAPPRVAKVVGYGAWLLREMGWWWTVTLLASLLTGFLIQSELVSALTARLVRSRVKRPRVPG